MDKDNRKNIYKPEINYSYISLMSKKLRIGIVGGGKAGTLKAKHFIRNGCYVEVLSKNFDEEIIKLAKCPSANLTLVNTEFSIEFLYDKHLVINAVHDKIIRNHIKEYCDVNYKIYIDASDFTNGMGVVPVQRNIQNVAFALNTKYGNPKGAVFLSNKIEELLNDYNDFIEFISVLRNKSKVIPEYKDDIITFVTREEFKKAFDEGKSEEELRLNFPQNIVDYLLSRAN